MRVTVWLALLSYLCVFNCSRDYPLFEKPDGRFPLIVGNEWRLSREFRVEFYSGHPPGYENPWIQRYSIHWQIVGRDVLDGHRSYVLKNEWYEEGGGRDSSLDWYTDSWAASQGLYHIAYVGGGTHPVKLPRGYKLRFAGEAFSSFQEIFDWVSGYQLLKQSPVVRIPPRRVLEYPLEVGKEWIAFDSFWLQTRKVVDTEPIITKAGAFSCYKIEVIGEIWKDSMVWYDWFSNEGLVKRYIWATGVFTGPYGNPVGKYEITDTYLLESYSITK